jgi:catechol 2,3-dioxygenase-like lactoylglutathione lyase family enzyme
MAIELRQVHPVLRMYDVERTKAFYVDYLGCAVDWEDGDASSGPVYLQVSRGPLALHLSSHHGDGTPGSVVLVEVTGIEELVASLHATGYGFMRPGLDDGPAPGMRSTEVIDPASNRIRFFERPA